MPTYADVRVYDHALIETDAVLEDDTSVFVVDVLQGGAVIIGGGSVRGGYEATTTPISVSSSPTHAGGWTIVTQAPSTTVAATGWAIYADDMAAGTYTITVTYDQGTPGVETSRVSAAALSIADCAAVAVASVVKQTVSANSSSTGTGLSGVLPQTHCLLIGITCGAYGTPTHPGTWAESYLTQANGSPRLGAQISATKVTVDTTVSFDTAHETVADNRERAALMVIVKAREASSLRYKFQVDKNKLTVGDVAAAQRFFVRRNQDWDDGAAEGYPVGSASAAVVGAATEVYITGIPSGAIVGDTVTLLIRGADGNSSEVAGVVEVVA